MSNLEIKINRYDDEKVENATNARRNRRRGKRKRKIDSDERMLWNINRNSILSCYMPTNQIVFYVQSATHLGVSYSVIIKNDLSGISMECNCGYSYKSERNQCIHIRNVILNLLSIYLNNKSDSKKQKKNTDNINMKDREAEDKKSDKKSDNVNEENKIEINDGNIDLIVEKISKLLK